MTSLRRSFLASISLTFALCALPLGCGQTTGSGDTGPDVSDVVTVDQGSDAHDGFAPDVPSDAVDAAPAFDAAADIVDASASDAVDTSPAFDAPADIVDASAVDAFDSATPDVRADATTPDVTLPDGSTACNTTVNDGPVLTITSGTGTPPTGTGGTITLGHYQLTSLVVYGSPPPPVTISESIDLTATTLNVVGVPTGMPEQRSSLTYSVSGTMFNDTQVCPSGASGSSQYTADATHFTVMSTTSGTTSVGTFTLH